MQELDSIASPSLRAEQVLTGALDARLEPGLLLLLMAMAGCGEARSLRGRVGLP